MAGIVGIKRECKDQMKMKRHQVMDLFYRSQNTIEVEPWSDVNGVD